MEIASWRASLSRDLAVESSGPVVFLEDIRAEIERVAPIDPEVETLTTCKAVTSPLPTSLRTTLVGFNCIYFAIKIPEGHNTRAAASPVWVKGVCQPNSFPKPKWPLAAERTSLSQPVRRFLLLTQAYPIDHIARSSSL